jgi:hypothetical protein
MISGGESGVPRWPGRPRRGGALAHLWEIPRPDTYFKPVGFGNMGFALPAIGLRLAADPALRSWPRSVMGRWA